MAVLTRTRHPRRQSNSFVMKSRRGAVVCLYCARLRFPFPLPASRTGRAVFQHPALPQSFTAHGMRRPQ